MKNLVRNNPKKSNKRLIFLDNSLPLHLQNHQNHDFKRRKYFI